MSLVNGFSSCGTIANILGISQLTMTAWIKRTATNNTISIGIGTPTSAGLSINFWNDGELYLTVSPDGGGWDEGYYTLNDTNWHHIALVFDGTQSGNTNRLKLYLNGIETALSFGAVTIPAATPSVGNFDMGNYDAQAGDGSLDEVRIYNRVLTNAEIQALAAQ